MESNQAELLIAKLAEAIADRIRPVVPIEHQLWTTKEIGEYLKVSTNRVVTNFASLPDFPRRIELPTAEGRKTHPRWKAKDVIQWVEGYDHGQPNKWR